MKKRSLLLIALSLGILCLSGCDSITDKIGLKKETEQTEEDKRITVKVDTPKVSSITNEDDFIGTIESEEQVYVVSKLSGDVTETFFEVGDYVNEGDLMFTIDDTAAQISYKQAQASLTSANATLNTAKAGVNTANANVNATQASVNENFGKAGTTEKQLQLGIDQAEVNFANNEVNIGVLQETLNDLNDKMSSTNDALDTAKSMADKAQAAFSQAADAYNKHPDDPVAKAVYDAAKKALSDANSGVSSLESAKDSLNGSIRQTEASLKTARNSNCLIVEQADIARDQKSDYHNYTRATIGNGGLASLASAQAGVVQAEAGVVQSKAGISQAQAAVDAAQLQLDYANVTAPVSGVITSKGVTKNNMAQAGSVAYTIMSDGAKYVSFLVSEKVMKELFVGQAISVDRSGSIYDAVITENPGVVDQQSGLFKVKAKVNAGDDIINGVMVKITMTTKRSENVMTVPIDAVYHESEKSYVYTYSNGKANKTYVETGLFDNEVIEIVSGLSDTDQVITTWSSQLRNGVEVKTDNSVGMNNSNSQSSDILIERD